MKSQRTGRRNFIKAAGLLGLAAVGTSTSNVYSSAGSSANKNIAKENVLVGHVKGLSAREVIVQTHLDSLGRGSDISISLAPNAFLFNAAFDPKTATSINDLTIGDQIAVEGGFDPLDPSKFVATSLMSMFGYIHDPVMGMGMDQLFTSSGPLHFRGQSKLVDRFGLSKSFDRATDLSALPAEAEVVGLTWLDPSNGELVAIEVGIETHTSKGTH
jgi:hypothetical protein